MSARLKNIVILISGAGTNMAAIIRAAQTQNWESQLSARVVAVISSKAEAQGLLLAQALGVATEVLDHRGFESRAAFDAALQARIDAHSPALVVLGWQTAQGMGLQLLVVCLARSACVALNPGDFLDLLRNLKAKQIHFRG